MMVLKSIDWIEPKVSDKVARGHSNLCIGLRNEKFEKELLVEELILS
jgi:hypothetical protein